MSEGRKRKESSKDEISDSTEDEASPGPTGSGDLKDLVERVKSVSIRVDNLPAAFDECASRRQGVILFPSCADVIQYKLASEPSEENTWRLIGALKIPGVAIFGVPRYDPGDKQRRENDHLLVLDRGFVILETKSHSIDKPSDNKSVKSALLKGLEQGHQGVTALHKHFKEWLARNKHDGLLHALNTAAVVPITYGVVCPHVDRDMLELDGFDDHQLGGAIATRFATKADCASEESFRKWFTNFLAEHLRGSSLQLLQPHQLAVTRKYFSSAVLQVDVALKRRVDDDMKQCLSLSSSQFALVCAVHHSRTAFFYGAASTGKTVLATYRVQQLARELIETGVSGQKILLVSGAPCAVKGLRSNLQEMLDYIVVCSPQQLPRHASSSFLHIVVDEGQEVLKQKRWQELSRIWISTGSFWVFADINQLSKWCEEGKGLKPSTFASKILQLDGPVLWLSKIVRNNKHIWKLAGKLYDGEAPVCELDGLPAAFKTIPSVSQFESDWKQKRRKELSPAADSTAASSDVKRSSRLRLTPSDGPQVEDEWRRVKESAMTEYLNGVLLEVLTGDLAGLAADDIAVLVMCDQQDELPALSKVAAQAFPQARVVQADDNHVAGTIVVDTVKRFQGQDRKVIVLFNPVLDRNYDTVYIGLSRPIAYSLIVCNKTIKDYITGPSPRFREICSTTTYASEKKKS